MGNKTADPVDLHLAAILLNRFEPLAPHHVGWIREKLGYLTDEELLAMVRTGKQPRRIMVRVSKNAK